MYIARGNEIFYLMPEHETEELFITVHPTKDCALTPAEQAEHLCDVLNGLIDKAVERAIVQVGDGRGVGERRTWYLMSTSERVEHITANAARIYVRAKIDGRWDSVALSGLSDDERRSETQRLAARYDPPVMVIE